MVCDVLADSQQTAPAKLKSILTPTRSLTDRCYQAARAKALFEDAYRDIVWCNHGRDQRCSPACSTTPSRQRCCTARPARTAPLGARQGHAAQGVFPSNIPAATSSPSTTCLPPRFDQFAAQRHAAHVVFGVESILDAVARPAAATERSENLPHRPRLRRRQAAGPAFDLRQSPFRGDLHGRPVATLQRPCRPRAPGVSRPPAPRSAAARSLLALPAPAPARRARRSCLRIPTSTVAEQILEHDRSAHGLVQPHVAVEGRSRWLPALATPTEMLPLAALIFRSPAVRDPRLASEFFTTAPAVELAQVHVAGAGGDLACPVAWSALMPAIPC